MAHIIELKNSFCEQYLRSSHFRVLRFYALNFDGFELFAFLISGFFEEFCSC